ncbi:MAG: type II secretion system F family protein [Candidatus Hadarchaeales archaeon]
MLPPVSLEKYSGLRQTLRKLRKPVSLEDYLSRAFSLSILVGILEFSVGFTILSLAGAGWIPKLLVAVLSPLLAYLTWKIFLWYPWSAAKGREIKIDMMLPSATAFMYALSRGGLEVPEIFRTLAQEKEDYGEVAVEAAAFVREVDYLGSDPIEALRNLAKSTPSEKFRRLIEFLIPVVVTGADLSEYFSHKCRELYQAAEIDQKRHLETLAFFAEFYVILMLFAPLILIITLMAVTAFYGASTLILYVLAYALIPLGSLLFIILLSTKSFGVVTSKKVEKKKYFVGIKTQDPSERKMLRSLLAMELTPEILRNPLRALRNRPSQVMYFSGGASLVFLALHLGAIDLQVLFFAFLIFSIPFAVFHWMWERRLAKTIEVMPDFLHSFASSASSGLTPAHAIRLIPTRELGPLGGEVEKLIRAVNWGESSVMGLEKVERECGNSYLSRTMAVVRRACTTRDDIGDVLQILASDATQLRNLKRERWASMFSYALIVYISFAVFLFCMIMLTRFTSIAETMGGVATTGTIGGVPTVQFQGGIPPVIWHATLLQALFSGLIAGQFSTGLLSSGLKHSILMMVVAFVVLSLAA